MRRATGKIIVNMLVVHVFCIFVVLSTMSHESMASVNQHPLVDIDIPQDEESLKRGALIYHNTCRMCHGMKYIRYQNLKDIGFSTIEIDKLRKTKLISDKFTSTITTEVHNEWFGMIPPDLSVMAKARKNGPQYIYTLMTSYYEKPEGGYDNHHFPGIKMPDVFSYSVTSSSDEKTRIESDIKDVTSYLLWASDPRAQERKSLGVYVIAYLIVLSLLFYFLMKRVWSRLDLIN